MRYVGYVARIREKWNAHRLLLGKPEGKGPLGRPRHKLVDNIKVDIGEIGLLVWIGLFRDQWRALVNKPPVSIKCWEVHE
jgi:hypothetical protein